MYKNNKATGKKGERQAKQYLIKKGYKIVCCNYRCPLGEIDIIARDSDYLVFVEVKTRITKAYPGVEAINYYKKKKLIQVAQFYLNTCKDPDILSRFDVVSIDQGKINLIKNAFILDSQ